MTRTYVLSSSTARRRTTLLWWVLIVVWAVIAIGSLGACSSGDDGGAASSSAVSSAGSTTSAASSSTSASSTSASSSEVTDGPAPHQDPVTTTAIPAPRDEIAPTGVDYSRCTNQTNYAADPRSNAEINSIGERTGACPPVMTATER